MQTKQMSYQRMKTIDKYDACYKQELKYNKIKSNAFATFCFSHFFMAIRTKQYGFSKAIPIFRLPLSNLIPKVGFAMRTACF